MDGGRGDDTGRSLSDRATVPREPSPGDWERRYARLYQASQSFLFSLGADGVLKDVTPAAETVGGWPISEWRTRPFSAFVHPDDRPLALRMFERVLAGESPERHVLRVGEPSGELHHVELVVAPEEVGGRIVGVLGMANDITSRKQAEERAARLERQLLAAQQITHIGSWEWNLASGQVQWSDEVYRIYGLEPRSIPITLETFSQRLHPDDRERVLWAVRNTLLSGGSFVFDERIIRPDGSVRLLESRGETVRGPDGAAVALIGTCLDVTEQREREAALRQAKEEYQHLVQSIQAIVWRGDPRTFRFTFVNQEAEALLGYPVARWLEEPSFWAEHLHPDDRDGAVSFCARASAEGRNHAFEFRMIAANGRVVWLRDTVRVALENGVPRENVGVMIDVTERRQAEEELRRSREQLSDLSAHVEWAREEERTTIAREIHDELGQALTALKMDIALLAVRLKEGPPQGPAPAAIERLAAMAELTEDTINCVRRIAKELRPGILDDLGLEAALEWAAHDFEARTGVACSIRSDLGEARLPRDLATAFFRIFQEALTNVARHAQAQSVSVSLRKDSGRLTLEVTDDGRGISEAALGGAKSLGLLGMRERARRLGGYLLVSKAQGRGTRVVLSVALPDEPAGGGG